MVKQIGDSALIDTWAASGTTAPPPDLSKINQGWTLGERPPHEYMNWLQNIFGQKINHTMLNGVPLWNSTTTYTAGASVRHSGSVWIARASSTNSAPSAANINWTRVFTQLDYDATIINTSANVTVGTGGDYATINDACVALSKRRLGFSPGGATATITLLSGFSMQEQLIVRRYDLSWIRIVSQAPTVTIVRSALTTQVEGLSFPAFAAIDNGGLPAIATTFVMDTSGSGTARQGYVMRRAGIAGVFEDGAGIINAAQDAIDIGAGSTIRANNCDFSGAGRYGAVAFNASTLIAPGTNFSGAGTSGVEIRTGSRAAIAGSNCRSGVSDASTDIVVIQGSTIAAHSTVGGTSIAINTLTSSGVIYK